MKYQIDHSATSFLIEMETSMREAIRNYIIRESARVEQILMDCINHKLTERGRILPGEVLHVEVVSEGHYRNYPFPNHWSLTDAPNS